MKHKRTIINESHRPDAAVKAMVGFVLDQVEVSGSVAVRVRDAGKRTRGHYAGRAGDRRLHRHHKWQGDARFSMSLALPSDGWDGFGIPRVCWHSSEMRRLQKVWRANGGPSALDHIGALAEAGATKFGRWPIYWVNDWAECLIHLAAHEARHLRQFDRGYRASEVDCEEWAAWVLKEWRKLPHPNVAGLCYDGVMANELPEIGSRWYVWGEHREVVELGTKDGFPAVRLRAVKDRKPERHMVIASSLVNHGIPTDASVSRYTEGAMENENGQATSPDTVGVDGSTDSTGKKVNEAMTTATKQKRQAKAQERAAKPKPAAKPSGDKLATDLLAAVRKTAKTVKAVETTTKRQDLKAVKLVDGENVLALVRVYPHRVRVFVRNPGEYDRYTVTDAQTATTAAAAVAAKISK